MYCNCNVKPKKQKNMETKTKHPDLHSLIGELQRQNSMKQDFIIPSNLISMRRGDLIIEDEKENAPLTKILRSSGISFGDGPTPAIRLMPMETCHSQLSEKLQIPKKYYDRMTSGNTKILDYSVSYWMKKFGKNCLLRTFIDKNKGEGYARAVLSDSFKMIDNFDLMLAALEAIKDLGYGPDFIQVKDADITDKRMYVRFVCPSIEVEAPELLLKHIVPGTVSATTEKGIISGFVISNSETGFGKYTISPRVHILACDNGRIFQDDNFSQVHLDAKMEEYSFINWSEETKQKNYQLIISQIKDAIKKFMSPEYLREKVNKMIEKECKIIMNPYDCVRNVCASLQVTEEKQKTILDYFMKGGEPSVFNLTQAMTFYAHKNATPDEQFELEVAASKVADNIDKFDKLFQEGEVPQLSLKMSLN